MRSLVPVVFLAATSALAQPGGQGDGIWRRDAYFGEAQTFDACQGHQPQTGEYHHHASPTCLRAQLEDNLEIVRSTRTGIQYREKAAPWSHSPILGWAFDGNPIYGPYGYSEASNASSAVRRLRSSFRLRSITARTSIPEWTQSAHANVPLQLNPNQFGPPINAEFPIGRYIEDYEYAAGSGDLDQYNGRQEVTPEFPQGTYAYHVTIDDQGRPVFPYILGGQLFGTLTGGRTQNVPAGVQEYFNASLAAQPGAADRSPALSSWQTGGATQPARVSSGFDPSAGPSTTWPTNIPTGARVSGGSAAEVPAETQRIRYSDTAVFVNSNGLGTYVMGPWFDATMAGGVFSNFPARQTNQMQFPRTPAPAASKPNTGLGAQGLWVNGVTVFNFLDGATYSTGNSRDVGGGTVVQTAVHVSAASNERGPAAPGSIMTAYAMFGAALATSTATAPIPDWPTTLGGATITVRDSAGVSRPAQIYYASPTQLNYRIPPDTATGYAAAILNNGAVSYTTNLHILNSYPNLFIADAATTASGYVTRIRGSQQTSESLSSAIDLGPESDQVYLALSGSGLGGSSEVKATIGGLDAPVSYAGPQGTFPGVDQINVQVPRALAGRGSVPVVITAAGRPSNAVNVSIR
ncbi:MAG: YHYH protein [Acidobacteria bacterium]|nr:YHYH protein [Acidobacteriota bacterium]